MRIFVSGFLAIALVILLFTVPAFAAPDVASGDQVQGLWHLRIGYGVGDLWGHEDFEYLTAQLQYDITRRWSLQLTYGNDVVYGNQMVLFIIQYEIWP